MNQPANESTPDSLGPPTECRLLYHAVSLLAVFATLAPICSSADAKPTVAVYGATAVPGIVDQAAATAITGRIEAAIVDSGIYQVLGRGDMERMRQEAEFQMRDECRKTEAFACYVEIGGAAGARFIVTADVGAIGPQWTLLVKLLDMSTTATTSTGAEGCTGSIACLLEAATRATLSMLGRAPGSTPTAINPSTPPKSIETSSTPAPALPTQSKPPETFFHEDFARIDEGEIPQGWLGAEHYAVRAAKDGNRFAPFERGQALFTIPLQRSMPDDFRIDIRFTRESRLFDTEAPQVRIGEILFGFYYKRAFINESESLESIVSRNGSEFTLSLERRRNTCKVYLGGIEKVFARCATFSNPDTINLFAAAEDDINGYQVKAITVRYLP